MKYVIICIVLSMLILSSCKVKIGEMDEPVRRTRYLQAWIPDKALIKEIDSNHFYMLLHGNLYLVSNVKGFTTFIGRYSELDYMELGSLND